MPTRETKLWLRLGKSQGWILVEGMDINLCLRRGCLVPRLSFVAFVYWAYCYARSRLHRQKRTSYIPGRSRRAVSMSARGSNIEMQEKPLRIGSVLPPVRKSVRM